MSFFTYGRKAVKFLTLFTVGIPIMGLVYFYEVYESVAVMTFKGHAVKRIKKSYYDHGYVRYTPEPDKNKRFENQILGAVVFVPVTLFAIVILAALVDTYILNKIF